METCHLCLYLAEELIEAAEQYAWKVQRLKYIHDDQDYRHIFILKQSSWLHAEHFK